ncbi:PQQ-dependent sugar dehydrogenase [Microbulbifer aestuariivivens]|uniref:PQQ-dependent sugar dehydrogenase n=1 Tax=Microbulbifer aestuariivivens TaxID=1908308 RepID=UPI0031E58893
MKYTLIFIVLVIFAASSIVLLTPGVNVPWQQITGTADTDEETVKRQLSVTQGFGVTLFADDVPNARWLAVTHNGDVLVSQPRQGQVSLLQKDANGDGRADGQRVLIDGLRRPHGLLLHEDWLYIAESDAIGRVPFDHSDGRLAGSYQRIIEGLDDSGNHWTKTIGLGPDGWIYLSSGSSCNVCEEENPRRATIMRFKPEGGEPEIFASGLRNSVGFDWSPVDGALYATDNGRDWLGDGFPPDELNQVRQGGFYGWPYANGNLVADPDFGVGAGPETQKKIAESIAPAHGFQAHNAPLGIHFLESPSQPASHRHAALVALHGSWNREQKDGYKVVSLHWDDKGNIRERDFLWGFLGEDRETVYGRPVAFTEDTSGNIYISDDYAGAVYRVRYGEPDGSGPLPGPDSRSELQALPKPQSIDSGAAQRGEAIYQRFGCAGCHGVQLPLTNLASKYSLQQLANYFDTPTPPMPTYDFSAAQKRALAHYLMSLEQDAEKTAPLN